MQGVGQANGSQAHCNAQHADVEPRVLGWCPSQPQYPLSQLASKQGTRPLAHARVGGRAGQAALPVTPTDASVSGCARVRMCVVLAVGGSVGGRSAQLQRACV